MTVPLDHRQSLVTEKTRSRRIAWHAKCSWPSFLLARLERLPQEVRNIAWKAQVRLCGRFRRLMARGKNRNTVITATARELAAFMWAIARTLLTVHEA